MTMLAPLTMNACSTPKTVAQKQTQAQLTPKLPNGEQVLINFCMDESLDKPGEYMGGYGVAERQRNRSMAITKANQAAIADIASKFIGMIKNAMQQYYKDTNTPSGRAANEDFTEGGIENIGSKVIEKYANAVCRQITQDELGGYTAYVAVHVEVEDINEGLAEELEVRKVEYDKDRFFQALNQQLNKMGK